MQENCNHQYDCTADQCEGLKHQCCEHIWESACQCCTQECENGNPEYGWVTEWEKGYLPIN